MVHTALLSLLVFSLSVGDVPAEPATVMLRATVRLAPEAEHVRLADVAVLGGAAMDALGEIVLGPAPRAGETAEFSLRQIRAALDEAGVHWGRTHLNGRNVIVRASGPSGASAPLAMAPVSLDVHDQPAAATRDRRASEAPEAQAAQLASALLDRDDLRSVIAEFLVRALDVEPGDLRIGIEERDRELLTTSIAARRFEIEAVSNVRSARIDLAIRRWEGGRIAERHTVSIAPTIRTAAAVLARDIERAAALAEADLEVRDHWLAPNAIETIVRDPSSVVGRSTTTRLRAGDLLRETHLQRELVVRRGELLTVRCIVGGAVISLQAEARANAAAGETIEFRKPGDRDTFLATVTGRGAAFIDLSRRHQ